MILGWFAGTWHEVADPVQARLLTDPASRALLEPFIGRERGLTEVAREVGCSPQRLAYWVRQFLEAGLLEETGQRARAGRPVRLYRTVAEGFHIPFALTPFEDIAALTAKQHAPFDRLRNRASARRALEQGSAGRRLYRDFESGEVNSESDIQAPEALYTPSSRTDSYDVSAELWLRPDDAQAFALELHALYSRLRASAQPEGQGQRVLVYLGLSPLTSGDVR